MKFVLKALVRAYQLMISPYFPPELSLHPPPAVTTPYRRWTSTGALKRLLACHQTHRPVSSVERGGAMIRFPEPENARSGTPGETSTPPENRPQPTVNDPNLNHYTGVVLDRNYCYWINP